MDRTIGSRAVLSKTLAGVSVFAYQAFLGTLDNLAAGLMRFNQVRTSKRELGRKGESHLSPLLNSRPMRILDLPRLY